MKKIYLLGAAFLISLGITGSGHNRHTAGIKTGFYR